MANEPNQLAHIMALLASKPAPANSLFLPLVPVRRFPPPELVTIPSTVLQSIVTDVAMQSVFPFLFGDRSHPPLSSKETFHDFVEQMRLDRELVIKRPIKIAIDESKAETDLALEYCFASKLLNRISLSAGSELSDKPYFYHVLVDLITQGFEHAKSLTTNRDDAGNYWLRLRDASPYRPNAFFSDVTILTHNIRNLVRVVFAEKDEDIDAWYLYEWLSPFLKDTLRSGPLLPPVGLHQQAGVVHNFFKKFSKFFTEKQR